MIFVLNTKDLRLSVQLQQGHRAVTLVAERRQTQMKTELVELTFFFGLVCVRRRRQQEESQPPGAQRGERPSVRGAPPGHPRAPGGERAEAGRVSAHSQLLLQPAEPSHAHTSVSL